MREGVVVERRRALHIGDALALQPGQCFHPDIAGGEDAQAVVAEGAETDPDFLRPPVLRTEYDDAFLREIGADAVERARDLAVEPRPPEVHLVLARTPTPPHPRPA